jgi:hypothetical protein
MRRSSIILPAVLSALVLSAGCTKKRASLSDAEVVARAKASVAPFKSALKGELERAMAESPEAAIDVCSKRAPELAREHSKGGVTVGRSALKLRNATNAPRPWLAPVMARLSKAPSGTESHEVVPLDGGRRGYAEAIWLGPQCVTCDGKAVPPSIAAKIDARYPGDAARGFEPGDFRGVFWVELDPE